MCSWRDISRLLTLKTPYLQKSRVEKDLKDNMTDKVTSPTSTLPTRSTTQSSVDDDAVPGEDTSEVTRLFEERLQAWKHAVVYIEDYIAATEKMHHAHVKEYEKLVKTVSNPLKEGHHFDQSLGGVAGLFDNIRSNTQGLANSNAETAKALKSSILPVFERLHAEIKNKNRELAKGAGKGAKAVDKARNATQKHIELLGQHTAAFDSAGGRIAPVDDPYLLRRAVMHRLNKQIIEENGNRQDLLAVQASFAQFEAHVVETIGQGIARFNGIVGAQAEQTRAMYADMTGTAQRIPPDFEWAGFVRRNDGVLIDPNAPARSVHNVSFANMDHRATAPLIAGSLEKKGKLLKKYDAGFYVVSAAKYLHEFRSDDDFARDPAPENSYYLPDCLVGAVDGAKFNVKGKDVSKGAVGNRFSLSHELAFRAHTPQDAHQWHDVIRTAAGHGAGAGAAGPAPDGAAAAAPMSPMSPVSPSTTNTAGAPPGTTADEKPPLAPAGEAQQQPAPLQTSGVTGAGAGSAPQSAVSPVAPASAGVGEKKI